MPGRHVRLKTMSSYRGLKSKGQRTVISCRLEGEWRSEGEFLLRDSVDVDVSNEAWVGHNGLQFDRVDQRLAKSDVLNT